MAEPIHDTLKRALQTADGLYHRLVLLVGEAGSGKTDVLRAVDARKSQRFLSRLEHGRPRLASPKRSWRNTNFIN